MCTEASYSFTATKGTCKDSSSTIDSVQGSDTRYKDVSRVGERAPMSAMARQPVSAAIKADQSSFQSYRSGVHGNNRLGKLSSGLRGLRPRNRRSMWQVRVGRQREGHFSRRLPVE